MPNSSSGISGSCVRDVIDRTETFTGYALERTQVDRGDLRSRTQNPLSARGAPSSVSSNASCVASAIESITAHLKAKGHLSCCYLKGRAGDAANVILSTVGYNFRRIPAWLSEYSYT